MEEEKTQSTEQKKKDHVINSTDNNNSQLDNYKEDSQKINNKIAEKIDIMMSKMNVVVKDGGLNL